jgi:ABC-type branched-subunit amino acid transport system substrate-binding protein
MARPSGARPVHLRATAPILALCAALPLLTGCLATDAPRRRAAPQADLAPPTDVPQPPMTSGPATLADGGGPRIGTGSVKVALVLPLSGQGAAVGAALRNAAQLAYDEAQQPDLSILVEDDRIVQESVAGGKRSFAALIPETAYGNAVEAEFRETVARRGARVAAVERYPAGAPGPAVERLARVITGSGASADALFIPETADGLPGVAAALTKAGFSPARVRPIGTALWNEPALFALPALQGGQFAAPDRSGFSNFSGRYQAKFGAVPPRVASLAYDGVMLAAALARQYGSQRFAETTLTSGAGFAGVDGTFRFRTDGQSERALAVYEIRNNAAAVVSPAPRVLAKPGI